MPSLKTFVVETDASAAGRLSQMLRDLGHEVCAVVRNVSQLAAMFEQVTPELIALDLDLADGNECLGLATVLQATGPFAIVFVGDSADGPERDDIRSIEGTALLTRPFGEAELRTAIALAFERARAVREGARNDRLSGG
jgi:DNA-binding response OmpR family regulator